MSVAEEYLELCLRLGRHVDGLVDSYYGPQEIATRVEAEQLRDPSALVSDAAALREENDSSYLEAQLLGLETVARKLAGEEIPYADEVERCYGIRPSRASEAEFEDAQRRLDEILPSGGSIAERYQRWREGDPVPAELMPRVLETITARLRERAGELIGLPAGESHELDFVTQEPWWAYNYYLGALTSRVAVNTDIPLNASFGVELMAHELYPGHHTEHAWKEAELFRGGGRLEESALMIGTPSSLIAEGIAGLAIEMVVDDQDSFAAEVFGEFGIDYDTDTGRAIRAARRPFERVMGNAALLVHEDGVSPEKAKEYIKRWGLVSEDRARHNVEFITHPVWRSYVTTYADGYHVCREWVNGDRARFRRLLTEQLTPADLRKPEA
ncbi:MAG TPA: hypothetical protein VGW30_04640 [Gaiellaceae bacterium]|nr:hypothetical protein [Gaiellaceae bacterium]